MLRIKTESFVNQYGLASRVDREKREALLVVGDALKIIAYQYDNNPAPRLVVIVQHVDPVTGLAFGTTHEALINGEHLAELMTPKPGQGGRKVGDYRMSDVEAAVVAWFARERNVTVEPDETLGSGFEPAVEEAAEMGRLEAARVSEEARQAVAKAKGRP